MSEIKLCKYCLNLDGVYCQRDYLHPSFGDYTGRLPAESARSAEWACGAQARFFEAKQIHDEITYAEYRTVHSCPECGKRPEIMNIRAAHIYVYCPEHWQGPSCPTGKEAVLKWNRVVTHFWNSQSAKKA